MVKINELLYDFTTFTSNDEQAVLDKIVGFVPLESFPMNEQVIIDNLIRKDLVITISEKGHTLVRKNGKSYTPFK